MIANINFDLVGNLIAKLREEFGLTQQDFATEIGVSKGAVCQWEQGSGIKTENLYDIAKYFNITVSELINGQLLEDNDYFERNYSLNEFEPFYEVNESNYSELLVYLKRCKNVIKRMMMLYPLHMKNMLTKKLDEEYLKISNYFKVDNYYLASLQLDVSICSIDEIAKKIKNTFEIQNETELDYELYKIFYLDMKIDPLAVLNYENDDLAANEYLELIGKERCDELLTKLTFKKKDDEIENSLPVRRLVEFGAICFFTMEKIQEFTYNEIDEDLLAQLNGVMPNKIIQDRYDFFKKEEKDNNLYFPFDIYSWKKYTKNGYEYLIDFDATNRIRDLVLLKDSNPKEYYRNLVERNAKFLEAK